MPKKLELSPALLKMAQSAPSHAVLVDLATAARDGRFLATRSFRRVVAYVMEHADGRDRREPWTTRSGEARPVPRLRIALEECFGTYADLHWFRLNKTVNSSGMPLIGLFPRMAASLARMSDEDFGHVVKALLSDAPDASLLRLLQERGGRLKGVGVELFSRLCFAFRRDLFFVLPRDWAERTGVTSYIDNDLRRYCALCRSLRGVCDAVGVPAPVRGSVIQSLLGEAKPPALLLEAVHKAMGTSLARWATLEPGDAYRVTNPETDRSAMPAEFAADSIRARRGLASLREDLLRNCGGRCAISGVRLPDLLEVAYVTPYPTGEVHCRTNAILLRSDLHTLWDLNLLGIEPRTLRVELAPKLGGTAYERLSGRTLDERVATAVSRSALEERWRVFAAAHRQAAPRGTARPMSEILSDSQVGVQVVAPARPGMPADASSGDAAQSGAAASGGIRPTGGRLGAPSRLGIGTGSEADAFPADLSSELATDPSEETAMGSSHAPA